MDVDIALGPYAIFIAYVSMVVTASHVTISTNEIKMTYL